MVRRFCLIIAVLALGLAAGRADEFKLVGGETLVGELLTASANDAGVQVKIGEGEYKKVPWANFSQDDLKRFAKIPKLEPLVEPFIEITQEEKIKKTEVTIKQPPRLEHPRSGSIIGAFFTSALGVFLFLVLYGANIYAGYEVSIFRAQPPALVCGVSAILPIAGPIIFLAMPTKMRAAAEPWTPAPAPEAAEAVNPMQAATGEQPGGLRIASAHPAPATPPEGEPEAAEPCRRPASEGRFAGFANVQTGPIHLQSPFLRNQISGLLWRGPPRR